VNPLGSHTSLKTCQLNALFRTHFETVGLSGQGMGIRNGVRGQDSGVGVFDNYELRFEKLLFAMRVAFEDLCRLPECRAQLDQIKILKYQFIIIKYSDP
jgi:hypothetical protein